MLKVKVKKTLGTMEMGFDCELPFGITAVLGPSGSGKSTLLKLVTGILTPEEGEISLKGKVFFQKQNKAGKAYSLPAYERRIGYVSQNYSLFPHLNVEENILFGVGKENPPFSLGEMVDWLRLEGLEKRRVDQLSGGQQQRVALARALMTRPALLLLDEPFSALDNLVRNRLRQDLLRIHQEFAIPIVFVTHNLEDALVLGDYVVIIDEGTILQFGKKDEVFALPNSIQTAKLLGMRNFIYGKVRRLDPARQEASINWEGEDLVVPWSDKLKLGQEVSYGIRGENINLIKTDQGTGKKEPNRFPAQIKEQMQSWMGYRLILSLAHTYREMEILVSSSSYERHIGEKKEIEILLETKFLCLLENI